MLQRVFHIDQQAFGAEVQLVLLRGPDQIVAGAVHVAHGVVVAAVVVAQIGVVGIDAEGLVELVTGFAPGVDAGEFADAVHVVARRVQFVLSCRREGQQGREHAEQQFMSSVLFHCR